MRLSCVGPTCASSWRRIASVTSRLSADHPGVPGWTSSPLGITECCSPRDGASGKVIRIEIVRKIDHVYAVLDNAEAAHRFLHEAVGLPIAWPYADHGSFASGGIELGNLALEFIAPSPGRLAQHPARLTGIAFEPAVAADEALLAELDRREIGHGPLTPMPGCTNVYLGGVGPFPFICDFHIPYAKHASARQAVLDACNGGRLGVRGGKELVVGVPSLSSACELWQRLLKPIEQEGSGRWALGTGPALRLVDHDHIEVLDLTLRVDDPDTAATLWAEVCGDADPLNGLPVSFAGG